jgi:hypothetical protein
VEMIAGAQRYMPVLADAVDPKTAIGPPAEPVLGSDAIDDRAVDPSAGERDEGNASFIEPRGRLEKASCAVADEVVELDAPSQWLGSDVPGYRLDEPQVGLDALVTNCRVRCLRISAALHVLKSLVPSGCE